jgi:hypothetical protein
VDPSAHQASLARRPSSGSSGSSHMSIRNLEQKVIGFLCRASLGAVAIRWCRTWDSQFAACVVRTCAHGTFVESFQQTTLCGTRNFVTDSKVLFGRRASSSMTPINVLRVSTSRTPFGVGGCYIIRAEPRSREPFHVSAEIGFDWSPVDAARAYSCEEDLLTQLMGTRRRPTRTEHRWTRRP